MEVRPLIVWNDEPRELARMDANPCRWFPRLTVRDMLWLLVLVSISAAWWVDHGRKVPSGIMTREQIEYVAVAEAAKHYPNRPVGNVIARRSGFPPGRWRALIWFQPAKPGGFATFVISDTGKLERIERGR